ncbi:MAG: ATP-binding protein [Crocosphaera sp.]
MSLNIKDTGIDIPKEKQKRIVERFYRVDSNRNQKTGGTGLGLAIAQAIAHHHQGYLTVKSQLGTGSSFKIYLPYRSNQKEAIRKLKR